MPEAKLPELKDCPRCDGGMKLSERPFFLPFACVRDGSFHAADDGFAIYIYVCLSCMYVELYTNFPEETLRLRPAPYCE